LSGVCDARVVEIARVDRIWVYIGAKYVLITLYVGFSEGKSTPDKEKIDSWASWSRIDVFGDGGSNFANFPVAVFWLCVKIDGRY